MSKNKKSKKQSSSGVFAGASKFANLNMRTLGVAGAGVIAGAAAVLLRQRLGRWDKNWSGGNKASGSL